MVDIIEKKKSILKNNGFYQLKIDNNKCKNIFIKDNDVIIFKKNITVSNDHEKNILCLKPIVYEFIKDKNIRLYVESQSNMFNEFSTVNTFMVKNLKDKNSVKSYYNSKCINVKRYSFWGIKVDNMNSRTKLRSIKNFNYKIHFVEDRLVS